MLKKITCFEQVKDLGAIILGNDEPNCEVYRIVQIDKTYIKLLRQGRYSRMRLFPFKNILEGEWYFDPSKGIQDIRSNTDSQLLRARKPDDEPHHITNSPQ